MPTSARDLDAARIRERLSATRPPQNPLDVSLSDFRRRLPDHVATKMCENLRPAGVLIPIIERNRSLTVLLTERSADLKHHAGQVSFPGGGAEKSDTDITDTALRETHEEVGIRPDEVDVAGYLDPMLTITGFAVTPVVGFVRESFQLNVDPVEVEQAFEVPLHFLMERSNERHSERTFDGIAVPVVTFYYEGHRIWGATASMLITLRQMLLN